VSFNQKYCNDEIVNKHRIVNNIEVKHRIGNKEEKKHTTFSTSKTPELFNITRYWLFENSGGPPKPIMI